MSKYTRYYTAKQDQYRKVVTNWLTLAADMNLSKKQRKGMSLFFKSIARRFGLIKEFRDLGVL